MRKTVKDFKIGDTVRIISGGAGGNYGLSTGSTTVVSDLGPYYVYVNGEKNDSGLGLVPHKLEVVRPAAPAVDFTKPLQTRDGRSVTLVTTEGRGEYPVIGYIDGNDHVQVFTASGKYYSYGSESDSDLQNVPKKPVEVVKYFNLYDNGDIGVGQDSRAEADSVAARNGKQRIGVKKLVLTEGQFDA